MKPDLSENGSFRGLPLLNGLASVTVTADTCMEADAWATAFLAMGKTAGPRLAKATGIAVIFVRADGTVLDCA